MGFWSVALPIAGLAVDAFGQSSANKKNIQLAREQMAFQEHMSSTEMQRRVADLKAAGLNPMLAGLNQQGASSAQGATTRVDPITRNTASTALAMATQRAQLENLGAQTRLLDEQRTNVAADTNLKGVTAATSAQQDQVFQATVQRIAQEVKNLQANYDVSVEDLRGKKLTNDQLEKLQPLLLELQKIINQGEQLGLSQKQVDAKFAEKLGDENRVIQLLLQIVRGTK